MSRVYPDQDHYRLDNMADARWTLGDRVKKELIKGSASADDAVSKLTASTAATRL